MRIKFEKDVKKVNKLEVFVRKVMIFTISIFAFIILLGGYGMVEEKKQSRINKVVEFRGSNAVRFIDDKEENFLYVRDNGKINIVKIDKEKVFWYAKETTPQDILIRLDGKPKGKIKFMADSGSIKIKETTESQNNRFRQADIWAQREYVITGRKPGNLEKAEYANELKGDVRYCPIELFSIGEMTNEKIENILSKESVTFVYSDFLKISFKIDGGSVEKFREIQNTSGGTVVEAYRVNMKEKKLAKSRIKRKRFAFKV